MFIDETEIVVTSGKGGDGMASFRREKFIPRGGPDGGNGGKGGDVILRANDQLTTLAGIQHLRHYRADGGRPGGTQVRHGRQGEPLVIELPVGTLIKDAEHGHVIKDLASAGTEVVIVAGGVGGKGNKHFANATNRAPRKAGHGQDGDTRRLILELRLVADVGLVGLPNAGKSTFLSVVSRARPKVADYPFTTLEPVLGLVEGDDEGLVIADIPGLIEGAHAGAGLGDRFLRHVQRTRVLLHLVDALEGPEAAVAGWEAIREELRLSGHGLDVKPTVLAASRVDGLADPAEVVTALEAASGQPVVALSSATGVGVEETLARVREALAALAMEVRKSPGRPPSKDPS